MNDDDLIEMLSDAIASERVPAFVAESGHRAWAWRSPDDELAVLVHDTLAATGLRNGGDSERILVFEHERQSLEVFIRFGTQVAHSVRLTLEPAQEVQFVVHVARVALATQTVQASSTDGEADLALAGDGLVRIQVSTDALSWTTPWFRLVE